MRAQVNGPSVGTVLFSHAKISHQTWLNLQAVSSSFISKSCVLHELFGKFFSFLFFVMYLFFEMTKPHQGLKAAC